MPVDPPVNPRKREPTPALPSKTLIKGLDAEQQNNAQLIASIGKSLNLSDRDIAIAIMTSMDESSLHNLKGGDRDSAGLFQQRPSQGWGSYDQVTNPQYSIRKFYQHLSSIHNRDKIAPWQAAQDVQQSAYADGSNYKQFWNQDSNGFQTSASSIAQYFLGGGPISGGGTSSDPGTLQGVPDDSILGDLTGAGISIATDTDNAVNKVWGAITGWEKAVEMVGAFFGAILWIFNVDHFMKFLLYVFGVIAVGTGLGLITFGGGKETAE